MKHDFSREGISYSAGQKMSRPFCYLKFQYNVLKSTPLAPVVNHHIINICTEVFIYVV
jgi:hypothetical protein